MPSIRSSGFAQRVRLARVFALLGLAAMPFADAAEPALERLVPPEAALVVTVRDLPGLRARLGASPWARIWADREIARLLDAPDAGPGLAGLMGKLRTASGPGSDEWLSLVSGDALLVVPASSLALAPGQARGAFLLALEIGDNEARLRELIAPRFPGLVDEHEGVTLFPFPGGGAASGTFFALHRGRLFLGSERGLVTAALDALAAGGLSESLADSARHRAVLDRSGARPDFAAHLDLRVVYSAMFAALEAARDPAQPRNLLSVEPADMLRALGLDALDLLSVTTSVAADGAGETDLALGYSEARGLVKLLAVREGPVARPDWVPATWQRVSSFNFSAEDFFAELERILDRANPVSAGVTAGEMRSLERKLRIDLRRDLIANLGPAVLTATVPPVRAPAEHAAEEGTPAAVPAREEMERFWAIGLADPAAVENALDALRRRFLKSSPGALGSFETREFLDRKVHVLSGPRFGEKGLAYAIADGWLLVSVGSSAPVEAVLQAMARPDAAASSFWAREDVRVALDSAPEAAFGVQVLDLPAMVASFAASLAKVRNPEAGGTPGSVDAALLPAVQVWSRHLLPLLVYGEREENRLRLRIATRPKVSDVSPEGSGP
jgi:hypothetical protein